MLLTLTTTHRPATDLGYLLHKHPAKVQTFALSFGEARVFYPRADSECCAAALALDVDPVALVRDRQDANSPWRSGRWNASRAANRCAAFTSACSASWAWKANPSIPGCNQPLVGSS